MAFLKYLRDTRFNHSDSEGFESNIVHHRVLVSRQGRVLIVQSSTFLAPPSVVDGAASQERFGRATVSSCALCSVPADPIWHLVYGEDISAWSLPHLLLIMGFTAIMITGVAIHRSTRPAGRWRVLGLSGVDLLVPVALAFSLLLALQLMTTEWDNLRVVLPDSPYIFWRRPEWLLPAVIAALAGFFGSLANRVLRIAGAATLVGLLALGVRLTLLAVFDFREISADAWIVALPVLLALDLGTAAELRLGRSPSWWLGGVAATIGLAPRRPAADAAVVPLPRGDDCGPPRHAAGGPCQRPRRSVGRIALR